MTFAGQVANSLGNHYEGLWTVHCMVDVMDEKADSISLAPPGIDGIEFFLRRKDKLEHHQVKLRSRKRWTLGKLENKQIKVLSHFWKNLSNPDVSFVFVSNQNADELKILTKAAREYNSWTEFKQKYFNKHLNQDLLNQDLSSYFYNLRKKWGDCLEVEAYEALKRIYIETVGEDFLLNTVDNRIAALVEGDPKNIRLDLADLAVDKIGNELTANDIWHYLQERGYRRREWGKDTHVLAAVNKVNERYLSRLQKEALAGELILRDEVDIIVDKLTSPESKRGVLVTGEAGVGKSGVILQSVEKLAQQGVPLIAFRLDNLAPTDSPDGVGEQLEKLPGSPAHVLANIAQGRNCVLVIDQLDAVSQADRRNPQFFQCVDEIITQAIAYPKMRLLLACRKFDLDYDSRLKKLTGENGIAEAMVINRLSHEKVRKIVEKLKLDTNSLNERQLELLSIPLHLKLLAEVAEGSQANVLNFRTAKDLYDKFWDYKKDIIHQRGNYEDWVDVISTLCDYMSENQRLSVPKVRVDRYAKTAELMASEHILVQNGQQYSFFHESFFDYAFARRFASEDKELLNFLGSREKQHLFRRAQVRQILVYERDAERDRYLTDLQALINSPDIRFHIKKIVFALLAVLDDPTNEEWEIIAPLRDDLVDPIAQQVWQILRNSVHWFQRLDSQGLIEQWLRSEKEELIDETAILLSFIQRQIPAWVAELAEPFIGVSESWRNRLNYLIQRAELHTDRRFFDFFLRLIREGILDQPQNISNYSQEFWMQIYYLPEHRPEWACEAISCYLNRYLELSIAAGQPNLFDRNSGALPQSQLGEQMLTKSARNAPQAFIEYLLPFMLRVIDVTALREGNLPWLDQVWRHRSYGGIYSIDDALLNMMEASLSSLAKNYPEDFSSLVTEKRFQQSNFETIQYLLIRAYAANGERFADEAIDYLCEQPARLQTGYSTGNGNIHAAPYWATRLLIEATTPHCSEEKLLQLQEIILDYYTEYEKTSPGRKFRGYPQLVLLDAVSADRRTDVINCRLQEWKRKFTNLELLKTLGRIEPPESPEFSLVSSPISEEAADKMTDEQWLKAITRYDYNDGGTRFERIGKVIGGAYQLSSVLESKVKLEPRRFAELIWRFPDNTNKAFFDAVLRGIAEVEPDVETAFRVCQRCHQLPNRPCGHSISLLIEKLADLSWSEDAFEILTWYALNDPNSNQELSHTEASSGSFDCRNILEAGINSTRGRAAIAIAQLIFKDKNRASYFERPLQQIVQDSSIAVRASAVEALIAVLNYDLDLAVSLFQQLCNTEDIRLLGTKTIEYFLYYVLQTHFNDLAPIVERMIISELSEVVEVGTRQACLASLNIEEARGLAEHCLSGTKSHRIAATEIFIANFCQAHFRQFCEDRLIQLFGDLEIEVRSKAARCFLGFKEDELGDYIDLVEAFINSPAFFTDNNNLIYALEETSAKIPDSIIYRVCDRFLESFRSNSTNVSQPRNINTDKISKLILKLYNQSKNKELQLQCLDLIDFMAQREVYGLAEALTEYER